MICFFQNIVGGGGGCFKQQKYKYSDLELIQEGGGGFRLISTVVKLMGHLHFCSVLIEEL